MLIYLFTVRKAQAELWFASQKDGCSACADFHQWNTRVDGTDVSEFLSMSEHNNFENQ